MRWLFDRNVLENESRAVIFRYIKENPETYAIKSIFAILILIVSMPAHASEENTLRIENITSISSIVNPAGF